MHGNGTDIGDKKDATHIYILFFTDLTHSKKLSCAFKQKSATCQEHQFPVGPFIEIDQEKDAVNEMKHAIMKQKEKSGATHVIAGDRCIVHFEAVRVRMFHHQDLREGQQTNQDALQPVNPENSARFTRVFYIIVDQPSIHEQQKPEAGIL
jgi:hypothetical protein